mgnify:CR=1 FL=1
MIFEQIPVGQMQNFSYLIGDEDSKEAAIVDPGWEVDKIINTASRHDLGIKFILITHSHYDHIDGVKEMADVTGAVLYVHKEDADGIKERGVDKIKTIDENDEINIGKVKIKVMHTPGHSPGSVCYLFDNKIITGDILFVEAVGRVDLPGGDIEKMFNSLQKFKKLDALINNVGIAGPTGTIEKLESSEWENTLHVNVNSHFYFNKQAIPLLKKSKSASIINISSGAGIMGFPLRSPYAASKWAVVGMTKTLAMELGKYKIRVNAICPGTIKGNRMKRVIRDKAKFSKISPKKIESDFISMASMKSWINEEDIGNMCAYLISDEANKISGQVIAVDGNAERMD